MRITLSPQLGIPLEAIIDLQYLALGKAWVDLLAAGGPSRDPIQRHEVYYDDDLEQQPVGRVDLFLSDFLGLAGLLAAYCRPLTA
ncbi:hypothetical protein C8A03DRAFT_16526 [Achaetomium macrosporum]|uniref:Uncharacterized protein n=1 Tax=Achaetomium macrosporum TaxID=79813 RepID=A0AAN7C8H2_9PEZI|nr:hypothetical protein C8A03DRAFT_16526 [Achaetomium macrosporum]